ncbi:hypothetical protein Tco_1518959, partial [Tanacetum coccineum]
MILRGFGLPTWQKPCGGVGLRMVKGLDVYGKSNEEENDSLWGIGFWREGLEKMYSNLNIGVKVWVFN